MYCETGAFLLIISLRLVRVQVPSIEMTKEGEGTLDNIRPPRLEDAGLEDCALPPESIEEAFLKAATAVSSRAASVFTTSDDEPDASGEEGRCVSGPWTKVGESSDTLVGIMGSVDPPPGACAAERGGGVPEVVGNEVVAAAVIDAEERKDKMVVEEADVPKKG